MPEDITQQVIKENQLKIAGQLIEKHGISPELASIAAQSQDPDGVALTMIREIKKENQAAIDGDLQRQLNDLAEAEQAALKRGDIAAASGAKRQAYRLRELHKNR